MIPAIIGAVALAAGVGYALGKNDTPKKVVVNTVTQKAEVSEDYVKRMTNRAGKSLPTNEPSPAGNVSGNSSSGMRFVFSGNFSDDFERIEDFLANPNVSNEFINDALDVIENEAEQLWNDQALNFVEYYREKIRSRRVSTSQQRGSSSGMRFVFSGNFSDDFERIEDFLANPNVSNEFINDALSVIENGAEQRWNDQALNFVAYYRERLLNRRR